MINENIDNIQLTTKQLEQILGVSAMTIHRWRKSGLPYTKEGAKVRFKLSEVKLWLEDQGAKMTIRK